MINPITAQLRRTDTDAVSIAEELMSTTVAKLPTFPGFERRKWSSMICNHDGELKRDSVHIEVTYVFASDASALPLVREQYIPLVKQIWDDEGHRIFREEPTNGGEKFSLEASATENFNLYYRVAHYVYFRIYSGCVARTDQFPDIPALGGVTPENDKAQQLINSSS